MSANQASIRAEIFERLDAYLDKSRREVRTRAAHPPPGGSAPTGAGELNSFTHDPTHPLTARRALPVHPPSIPPTRAGYAQVERAVRARATHHRVRRGRPSRRCALARLNNPTKHDAAPRMNDKIASIASSDRSPTTYRRAARRRGATHPGDGATPTPGPAHTHTRRREPPSGERREKDDDRE